MRGSSSVCVIKGSWTREEDILLKQCVLKYGEGKWHLVPSRAALSRCRKSCRLRWLNYLKPDIKRGQFMEDEIDLILRLHKLLGNRWSLIAGRIPGRTANDIKNYWNTHLRKKIVNLSTNKNNNVIKNSMPSQSNNVIIKPRPRKLYEQSNHGMLNSDGSYVEVVTPQNKAVQLNENNNEVVNFNWWESCLDDFDDRNFLVQQENRALVEDKPLSPTDYLVADVDQFWSI